ncbi:MAG: hypothetical protein GWN58_42685, partial [Anaerolineae bacterium]|nr:hypothetical protein [Anaerolineae bacterium]
MGLFIAGLVYLDGRQQGLPEGEGAIGHTENILQRLKEKAKQGGQAPAQSERPAPVESKPAP